jgi:hypothetical protein
MAEQRGHSIKRWNKGRLLRYTAVCEKCRATLAAFSRAEDRPGQPEALTESGDHLIVRDRDRYWTELDYNCAEGTALQQRCY